MNRIELSTPTLILGVGIGASGKSTLLRELARRIANPVYIDKDTINYAFLRLAKPGDFWDIGLYRMQGDMIPRSGDFFRKHVWRQSYDLMLRQAQQSLDLGLNPILEGNYVKEIRKGYIEGVIRPLLGLARIKIILTHATESIIRERQTQRSHPHDPVRTEREWTEFFAEQPPIPPEIDTYDHFKVDTSGPVDEETFDRMIAYLQD
jgi:predicted kinase